MPEVLMVSITLDCDIRYTAIGMIIRITIAAIALPVRAMPPAIIVDITVGSVFNFSSKMVPWGCNDHKSRNANKIRVIHAAW